MPDVKFSAEIVLKYLANLSFTSPDTDNILPDILKTATHFLA